MTIKNSYPAIRPSLNLDFANAKVLDPRITFSRASAATYYDGKTVAKAEENLLLYSQDYDNALWLKTGASLATNSVTAPDGSVTADTVTSTVNSFSGVGQSSTLPAGQYVMSVFAKAGASNFLRLAAISSAYAWFDLANGVVGTVMAGATAFIQSYGNGWYRCIVVTTGTPTPAIRLADADNSTSAAAGNSVHLWGAQLEQRSQVTAYTPTTTQPITNYIPVLQTAPAGVPRFDHNPMTCESLGLLVEEQRTNLIQYSEQFDSAFWAKTSAVVSGNVVIAPDGTITADKLVEAAALSNHRIFQAPTVASGIFTASFYLKAAERQRARVAIYSDAAGLTLASSIFDLQNGLVANTSAGTASIQPVGNGWYRCTVSVTTAVTAGACRAWVETILVDNSQTYQGDGYSGIYIWGAQLEAGAFPTSYIKTEANQVTRAAESASLAGVNFSSWYRQDEGTLFADYVVNGLSYSSQFYVASANTGSGTSNVFGINSQATISQHRGLILDSSANIAVSLQLSSSSSAKAAFAARFNDFSFSLNGSASSVDTLGSMPSPNTLSIGTPYVGGAVGGSGHIKRIAYYPKRLTNAQLQSLTA